MPIPKSLLFFVSVLVCGLFFASLAKVSCAAQDPAIAHPAEELETLRDTPTTRRLKTVSTKKLFGELQKLGREYSKGGTSIQTETARAELVERIAEVAEGKKLKLRSRVREVRWKDGFAQIYTEPTFSSKVSRKAPLRISRLLPFEIEMTQAEAGEIAVGTRFDFEGVLEFHPLKWGAVGPSIGAQQMYDLRHEYLGGGYLGTFTTKEYEIEVGGATVTPHWATTREVAGDDNDVVDQSDD